MSGSDELKNMLLTFRVSELQMLLGYAGLNKTGRKTELQARAIELLKNKSVPHLTQIHAKIRELYKTIQLPTQGLTDNTISESRFEVYGCRQGGSVQGGVVNQAQPQPQVETALVAPPPPPQRTIIPPQQQPTTNLQGFIPISPNVALQSRAAMYGSMYGYQPKVSAQSSIYPIQPDVRLKRLPFYDILGELLKPSSLVPNGSGRAQEGSFIFYLTPQQATDIAMKREVGPGTKNEYHIQVQLRFCLLETSCEQEDIFPPGVIVKVNGKLCPLPNPIPTNKPGVEPKRPPRPVNISSLVKLSPSVANHINVSWNADYTRGYVIAVNLVRKLTAADLLHRLKAKGIRHADFTTGLIKEKLSEDGDSEIATTSLRVSLLCPLGKMRMSSPARSTTCTHLQCFDASLFLQMNEKKATWTCPVCDRPALYDNLVIDGYFQDVLISNRLSPDSHEIQLHQDGTWSSHVSKKESACVLSPSRNSSIISKSEPIEEILDDSDEPIVMKQSPSGVAGSGVGSSGGGGGGDGGGEKREVITVDLTLSDDDEPVKPESSATHGRMTPIDCSSLDMSSGNGGGSSGDSPSVITLDSPSPPPASSPVPPPPPTYQPPPPPPPASPPSRPSLFMHVRMPHDSSFPGALESMETCADELMMPTGHQPSADHQRFYHLD